MIRSLCLILVLALGGTVSAGIHFQLSTLDAPDTVLASNTVVDIVEHAGGVWMITPDGVQFSFDQGQTWLLYDETNGLVSSDLSAIYSQSGRIWIASNHDEVFDNIAYPSSDALSYSDDNGFTWTQVDFGSTGLDIDYVWGVDRTVFDITGMYQSRFNKDWLFFTAFAGGLLSSNDNGATWRRLYSSRNDSLNFYTFYYNQSPTNPIDLSLSNLYFSAVADSSHADSVILWAGSAGGLFQYIFSPADQKPNSRWINKIVIGDCDTCDYSILFWLGENGVTRSTSKGSPYISRDESHGLPGPFVTSGLIFQDKLVVGTAASDGGLSTGIAVSDDPFGTMMFQHTAIPELEGAGVSISDLAAIDSRIYLAGGEAGLYVSDDGGASWTHMYVDPSNTDPSNRRNVVHSLAAVDDTTAGAGDTLWVGTDSSVVALFMDETGTVDSSYQFVFPEGPNSSSQVVKIALQDFITIDTMTSQVTFDSQAVWTANHPTTLVGHYNVGRGSATDRYAPVPPWNPLTDKVAHDFAFNGDTVYIVGETSFGVAGIEMRFPDSLGQPQLPVSITVNQGSLTLDNSVIYAIEALGDSLYVGSETGFAIRKDVGQSFTIVLANSNPDSPDQVVSFGSNIAFVSNFLMASGLQYMPDEVARVWVSNHPAGRKTQAGTGAGITVGLERPILDTLTSDTIGYSRIWGLAYGDDFAWNFAFNGEEIFAASNAGLLHSDGIVIANDSLTIVWDTIPLLDQFGDSILVEGAAVLGVEVVDSFLWVGTDDRTLRLSLDDFSNIETFAVVDTTADIYAYPVPFSHSLHDRGVQFHVTLERPASVSIEVYDFAMNLVATPVDNVSLGAGSYPASGSGRLNWDGVNDRGDEVAVGMYYFRLTTSEGLEHWGKVAVIP